MDMSTTLTRIKLSLGLMAFTTPFKDLNGTLQTIIQEITLPVFSQYNPVIDTMRIHTKDLEMIDRSEQYKVYLLPDFKTRKLLYVFNVTYDDSCLSGLGYYGGGMPLMTGNLINQAMLANAGAGLINTMLPKMTFKYEHPRKLYLYNLYASSKIVCTLGFQHDKSLATISETARESFMKLALLDAKANLYPTLKMYTQLNTSIGSIDLKLDDWANAEQERNELINQWDDNYILDIPNIYYY